MLARGARSARQPAAAFRLSPREQAEQILRDHRDLVLALVHEVRTPLAVIRGQVDVLEAADGGAGSSGGPGGSPEALAIVREAVAQVVALTDDLLAMARDDPETPPLLAGPVLPTVRAVAPALVQRGATRNVLVHCDIEHGLPVVCGVGPALQAVLQDLCAYLVDRVPAGAIVTIAAAARGGGVELSVATDVWRDTPGRPDRGGPSPLLAAVTRRRVETLGGAFAWQAAPPRYSITLPGAGAAPAGDGVRGVGEVRKVVRAATPR